ncbi:hypothetical protein [Tenacibaculum xiamenense]|uniref:hypothetical protein n=1 Tax=Tenacibaculum xiamenense TaxID=1261553 RepID=UPI0038965022
MRGIKRKFKYLVAKTLLFIIFTGGFFSCQNNNEQITLDNNKKFVVRAIQKKEIKENHILVNRIDKINQQNNGLKGGNHEIKLNKEYATYLESVDGTYHSYTFKIDNQNRNNFDIHNLVLSLSKNNQYKAYLVKYSLTKEERESIDRGSYLSLIDKVTI